jgi:hypothetical protein
MPIIIIVVYSNFSLFLQLNFDDATHFFSLFFSFFPALKSYRNKNLDAILEEEDGRTTLWMWKTQKGGLSSRRVLSREGDCM